MMLSFALVLAFLVCLGFGQQIEASSQSKSGSKEKALLALLQEVTPRIASFNPSASAARASTHVNSGRPVSAMQAAATEKKIDIYRDTPLRYAGYLNEIGEAFRPIVPVEAVYLSYALAISYVMADGISKGGETAALKENEDVKGCGSAAVIDTLVFQFLASVIFPSTVINRVVALCGFLADKFAYDQNIASALGTTVDQVVLDLGVTQITPASIDETTPTVIGLALIPLIVYPIDTFTESILDNIVRPRLEKAFPDCFLPFCNKDACDDVSIYD